MASTHAAEGKYCRLHIRVRAEGCGHGCVVGIGGSCGALGHFDPRQVLALVTTPEAYPVWSTAQPLLVSAEELLSYKFCIIEGGAFKAFEDLPSPRCVIPSSVDTIVENIFNPALIERSVYESEAKLLQILDEKTHKAESASAAEDIGVHGSLYVVCYHLPVVVERTGTVPSFAVSWGDSLIARTDGAIADAMSTHWVGSVRVPGDPLTDTEKSELVAILLRMNCVVIFIEQETHQAAYYGYCKQVLWPVFHNVDQLDGQGTWQEVTTCPAEGEGGAAGGTGTGTAPAAEEPSLRGGASVGSLNSCRSAKSEAGESECSTSGSYTWGYALSYMRWWEAYRKVNTYNTYIIYM
jgi:hypothetical protein